MGNVRWETPLRLSESACEVKTNATMLFSRKKNIGKVPKTSEKSQICSFLWPPPKKVKNGKHHFRNPFWHGDYACWKKELRSPRYFSRLKI